MIHFTETEFQFVVSAIKAQTQKLIDELEIHTLQEPSSTVPEENLEWFLKSSSDGYVFKAEATAPTKAAFNPDAPYGLKKDGTPAKRRGAKSKKVAA